MFKKTSLFLSLIIGLFIITFLGIEVCLKLDVQSEEFGRTLINYYFLQLFVLGVIISIIKIAKKIKLQWEEIERNNQIGIKQISNMKRI